MDFPLRGGGRGKFVPLPPALLFKDQLYLYFSHIFNKENLESISKYRENSPSLLKLQVSQPIFGINIAKLRSYYIHSYLPNLFYVTYPKNVPLSLRNYFNYVTWIFHHLLNHFFLLGHIASISLECTLCG